MTSQFKNAVAQICLLLHNVHSRNAGFTGFGVSAVVEEGKWTVTLAGNTHDGIRFEHIGLGWTLAEAWDEAIASFTADEVEEMGEAATVLSFPRLVDQLGPGVSEPDAQPEQVEQTAKA